MTNLHYSLFLFFSFSVVFTQTTQRDYNDELRYQNDAINSMKKEMEELRSKIQKANTTEITTAKRITNLDEEIALVNRFVQSLKNEEKRTKDQVLSVSYTHLTLPTTPYV